MVSSVLVSLCLGSTHNSLNSRVWRTFFWEKTVFLHSAWSISANKAFFSQKLQAKLNPPKSQGKWKKFEIAGFRNNRGSVKFVIKEEEDTD